MESGSNKNSNRSEDRHSESATDGSIRWQSKAAGPPSTTGGPCPPKRPPPCPPNSEDRQIEAAIEGSIRWQSRAGGPPSATSGPCPPKPPPPCPPKPPVCPLPCEKQDSASEQEKESKGPVCKTLWHPGFDARFPNTNQTRRCWQNYVDYMRCQIKFGEDYEPCEYFKKTYEYICPGFWIEKWDEQVESGTFPMPKWA